MEKLKNARDASLFLQDGTIFHGKSFGFNIDISGEVVFNTGMVGYPESLTDPSYRGQILTLTYPLIGNYGVPPSFISDNLETYFESNKIQVTALIVSQYSKDYFHWNAKKSLSEWLIENKTPAITGIDTRALTKILRTKGTMLGKIVFNDNEINYDDPNTRNLVDEVSIKKKTVYGNGKYKIMLVDCGTKNNIIRSFLKRDCTVIRVPWDYDFISEYENEGSSNKKNDFDGLFISNGPGDPKMCKQTIIQLSRAIKKTKSIKPIFGICLGNQLLALAAGANTYKLKFGHRSQNQPCVQSGTKHCYITSQNHGFAIDQDTLPQNWEIYFENANDGTCEGIRHKKKPFFSVQFHPEASCGPTDTEFLFDKFIEEIKKCKKRKK